MAIISAVVLLVAAGSAIALKAIGDDAEREAARTPIKATGGPDRKAAARKRADAALVRQGELYSWPRRLEGFTVVLQRTEDRAAADTFARSASEGAPAKIGVIRTDDFSNLEKGFFVVFAGHYETREAADRAADRLGGRFDGAVAQVVEP